MLSNWLKQRRLRKHSAEFAQLLRASNTAAALDLYDAQLAPDKADLSSELRAAYHLARWFSTRRAEDAAALRLLTAGAPVNSQLAATWAVVQRLQRESSLATALRQCNAALLSEPAAAKANRQSETLEALALALLETCPAAQSGLDEQRRRASAQTVLRLLPAAAALPDEATRKLRAHLLVWAAHTLDQHKLIAAEPDIFTAFSGAQRTALQLAVAFHQARVALHAGRSDEALRAFKVVPELADAATQHRLGLFIGREAIEQGAGAAAVDWFTRLRTLTAADDSSDWPDVTALALGLAQLGAGQYAAARELLVPPDQENAAAQAAATANGHGPVSAQRLHLATLSLLAGTADWAAPARSTDDPAAQADAREIAVQNRALWQGVRTQLEPLIARLSAGEAASVWQGHLLAGLLAYVDRNTAFAPAQLAQFAAAIEHVPDAAARTKLKYMEGALVSRAQATDEATRLVRRKDYARLRELNDTVLASLGDTIPTLVRAAVYLTLWQGEPQYDPLPDLQRLPRDEADEAQVNECIRQVQIAQTLRRLSAECVSADEAERVLPALAPLFEFNEQVAARGALAVALIHLRRGHFAAARDVLPATPHEQDRASHAYVSFYLAWQEGDVQTCRALLRAKGAAHPLLLRYANHTDALSARAIVQALETNQEELLLQLLLELGGGQVESVRLPVALLRLVLWLSERGQPQQAQTVLQTVWRAYLSGEPDSLRAVEHLNWVYLVLSTLIAAQLGQYSACIEAVNRLLAVRVPPATVFGAAQANERVVAWLRFFRLVAELALAAGAEEAGANRWRAVQRTFAAQAAELEREPGVQPFIYLIGGLLASLSADTVIDDALIARLVYARQSLELRSRASFIDGVIGQLTWRQQVVTQFWAALRASDFKQGRAIYQEELLPAFGERMPHPLQLGMILATWGANTSSAADLLHRLDVLAHDAPDLDPAFIASVRNHIQDGEKYRRLVAYLQQQQFDEVIALIDQTDWLGFEPGLMPIAVAITLLYAYYKTKQNDEAIKMGQRMAQATHLSQWVQDYGALILGYVLFDAEKYASVETNADEQAADAAALNAADVFAQISQAEILGHNTDKYWAAAHFNQGLQLLKVNQRVKAFDAFTRALGQRGGGGQAKLAPLFLHFGLQNLEQGNGNRAQHAFGLMRQSLVAAPDFTAAKRAYLALLDLPPDARDDEIARRHTEYRKDAERTFKQARKTLKEQVAARYISPQEFEAERKLLAAERTEKEQQLNELSAAFQAAQDAEDSYARDLNYLNEDLRAEYITQAEYDERVRTLEEQYAALYQGDGGDPEQLLYLLLADVGRLICETLIGTGEADPGGAAFLELLRRIEHVPDIPLDSAQLGRINARPFLERDLRLLAIEKELLKHVVETARRRSPANERERERLREFIAAQITAVEALMGEAAQQDVALLTLKALCELRLRSRGDSKAALEWIEQALRLGAQSGRLAKLREEYQQQLTKAQATSDKAFDLFDQYLADGAVPLALRTQLVSENRLAILYGLSRPYTPSDLLAADTQHGIPVVRQQLEHLQKFITDEKLDDDERLRPLRERMQTLIKKLNALEQQTQDCQKEVLSLLSEKLRAQPIG